MPKLMVCAGPAWAPTPAQYRVNVGRYLKEFDADAWGGRGMIIWTGDRTQALRFADLASALDCWKRQSRARPIREDGQPNRPLTAYNITIEDEDDGQTT